MVRDAHAVEVLEEDAIVRAIVPDEEALLSSPSGRRWPKAG
jgi:hypothetical protein